MVGQHAAMNKKAREKVNETIGRITKWYRQTFDDWLPLMLQAPFPAFLGPPKCRDSHVKDAAKIAGAGIAKISALPAPVVVESSTNHSTSGRVPRSRVRHRAGSGGLVASWTLPTIATARSGACSGGCGRRLGGPESVSLASAEASSFGLARTC